MENPRLDKGRGPWAELWANRYGRGGTLAEPLLNLSVFLGSEFRFGLG
jgi:hypothetical protein